MNNLYNPSDLPDSNERNAMWNTISASIQAESAPKPVLHWRSFWLGNAAALLIGFALIGIISTGQYFSGAGASDDPDQQIYATLNSASDQLKELPPILIGQAADQNKPGLESTARAIEEIDRLIDEIRQDILIHGETPAKRNNLKRLYATKLDFYKDLLLKEEPSS